jgi:Pyridoxal-dependent decarboxylase conserved domain
MSLELTAEQREQLGRAALEWTLQYFDAQSRLPIHPTIGEQELSARLASALPNDPQDPAAVMADFQHVADAGRHNGHPRMFGYVQSAGSFAGVVGDLLASALNQNVTSWRSAPSATTIEHQVIDWMKEMVGFDPRGSGVLLSGGSFANFAALAAALRASTDVDVNRRGVAALPAAPLHLHLVDDAHVGRQGGIAAWRRQGRDRDGASRRFVPDGSGRAGAADRSRSRRRASHRLRGGHGGGREYRCDRPAGCDRRRVRGSQAVAAR